LDMDLFKKTWTWGVAHVGGGEGGRGGVPKKRSRKNFLNVPRGRTVYWGVQKKGPYNIKGRLGDGGGLSLPKINTHPHKKKGILGEGT